MTRHSSIVAGGSIIERAADIYDFRAALKARAPAESRADEEEDLPAAVPATQPELLLSDRRSGFAAPVDRAALAAQGFIDPDTPVGPLAEEFRIAKRQLLSGAEGGSGSILVCSAHADEGKTFCAVNLALSLAGEKGIEVLLVDGDFSKPQILSILGIEDGPGLIDAIHDEAGDANDFVIQTDIDGLSVLPAGRRADDVTELLSSARASAVLERLAAASPRRLIIFDSPPLLAASATSALASHVGQAMLVVRADRTTEADLRQAVALLSGCDTVRLLLNGADRALSGGRFGSYYGEGR